MNMNIGLWTTNHIPRGINITIPAGQLKLIYGDLTLYGRLTIQSGGVLALLDGTLINGGTLINNGTLVEKAVASAGELEQIRAIAYQNLVTIAALQQTLAQSTTMLEEEIAGLHAEIARLKSWTFNNTTQIETLQGQRGTQKREQQEQDALLALLLQGGNYG